MFKFFRGLFWCVFVGGLLTAGVYFVGVPVFGAVSMPDEIRLTSAEIGERRTVSPSQFVTENYEISTDAGARPTVELKLFGLFPLKRVSVDVLPYDKLVAGGIPVGFIAKTDGVVVLHDAHGYRRGEVITSIDSATITSVRDMERVLGSKRPGIWVKDDTSGVGTLTYVNPENNNFAALGHKLVDNETGADVNLRSGEVYTCNVLGVEPSKADKIGTLQSTLRKATHGVQGSVLSSNSRGVFGCLNSDSVILDWCKNVYPIASRYSVKPGKATILVALDGENVVEYDAQIVKTRYQKNNSGKGIILKITDPRLLEQAGGIVHGMSGSPIIQNGHFVGAVTHVIAGDVTRGYGIYIDFIVP